MWHHGDEDDVVGMISPFCWSMWLRTHFPECNPLWPTVCTHNSDTGYLVSWSRRVSVFFKTRLGGERRLVAQCTGIEAYKSSNPELLPVLNTERIPVKPVSPSPRPEGIPRALGAFSLDERVRDHGDEDDRVMNTLGDVLQNQSVAELIGNEPDQDVVWDPNLFGEQIRNLYDDEDDRVIKNLVFGEQIRNLYDDEFPYDLMRSPLPSIAPDMDDSSIGDFECVSPPLSEDDEEHTSLKFEAVDNIMSLSEKKRAVLEPIWFLCVRFIYLIADLQSVESFNDWVRAFIRFIAHSYSPYNLHELGDLFGLPLSASTVDSIATMCANAISPGFVAADMPWVVKDARGLLTTVQALPQSELFQKGQKTLMGLFCFPVVKQMGMKFSLFGMESFSEKHVKKFKFNSMAEMAISVSDLLLTLTEVGYMCFAEGSLRPLMRVNRESQEFVDRVVKVKDTVASRFTDDAWDANDALSELVSLRELGYALARVSQDRIFIMGLTAQVDKMLVDLSQRAGVSAYRRAPFSVMIYGTPGIGKSYITNAMLTYYHQVVTAPCKEFPEAIYPNLQWDPQKNLWTKNFCDDFDSDYKGNIHWAVVLDDLGQENVRHVQQGVTNSIVNLFSLVNTVGYASTQAELELKGKIPKIPKMVVASTNTKDLNAYHAVASPAAVARRLPIIIEPILKPEFRAPGSGVMKQCEEAQRDAWVYRVEEVKLVLLPKGAVDSVNELVPGTADEHKNMTAAELYPYLRKKIIAHELNQRSLQEALRPNSGDKMCSRCFCPGHHCTCEEPVACDSVIMTRLKYWAICAFIRTGLLHFAVWMYLTWIPVPKTLLFNALQYWWPSLALDVFRQTLESRIPAKAREFSGVMKAAILGSFVVSLCAYAAHFFTSKKKDEAAEGASGIWHKGETFFRVPSNTMNDGGASITKALDKSMIHFVISARGDHPRSLCAVNLGNGNLLTVGHCFKDGFDEWACATRYSERGHVEANMNFLVNRSNLTFLEGRDLVIVRTGYAIPRRDLTPYLPDEFSSAKGNILILMRGPSGKLEVEKGVIVDYLDKLEYAHEGRQIVAHDIVLFKREKGLTVKGDCGSIILAQASRGWYVHSLISAGDKKGFGVAQLLKKSAIVSNPLFSTFGSEAYFEEGNATSGKLQNLSERNKFTWTVDGQAEIVGSFDSRTAPKSRVEPSKYAAELRAVLPIEIDYGPPVMKVVRRGEDYVDPWVLNINKQFGPNTKFPDSIVQVAAASFAADLLKDTDWLSGVAPVSEEVAINGEVGNPFVNGLPMGTSGGFVQSGPKRFLFERENDSSPYVPKQLLRERIDSLKACYVSGERACVLMSAHLKDEPVSSAKIEACKTRVFTGCAVDTSVVMRQQYLKVTEAFMRNNILTECMVGLNCYGPDWEKLFYHLTRGEKSCDTMIFGDFKAFDKQMPCVLVYYAFWVLTQLNVFSGTFSEEDLKIQMGLATDISYPYINFNGDVVMMYGSNSSGHPLTVIVNSIANSLYMRICYMRIFPEECVSNFKRDIRLATLGDDNVMSSIRPEFNHTSVQKVLAGFGIEYTMPDKESLTVPFVSIFDFDFLKRKFKHFEGKVIAPLELESTFKSLVCIQKKGNISDAEQTAQAYLSARREWSLHGKEVFDRLTKDVDRVYAQDDDIMACFIHQHTFDWRQTFDWVCSGVCVSPILPLDGFEACGKKMTSKEKKAFHLATLQELEAFEQAAKRTEDQRRKAERRKRRKAKRLSMKEVDLSAFEAMDATDWVRSVQDYEIYKLVVHPDTVRGVRRVIAFNGVQVLINGFFSHFGEYYYFTSFVLAQWLLVLGYCAHVRITVFELLIRAAAYSIFSPMFIIFYCTAIFYGVMIEYVILEQFRTMTHR